MTKGELKRLLLQGATEQIVTEFERLRAELEEQCRLLGMSGSREAKHLAEIEALKRELASAREDAERYRAWRNLQTDEDERGYFDVVMDECLRGRIKPPDAEGG